MIAGAMYAAFLTNSRRDAPCFDISLATFSLPGKFSKRNAAQLPRLPTYRFRQLTDQQIQLLQSAHNRGYVIQHHLFLYVKFLRKQSRNLNWVRYLLPVLPDEARGFIKLMNLIEFRVEQQQVLLNFSQDKAIPPLDRNCHRTPESCGVKFRKTTGNLILNAAESDSEVMMELPKSKESVWV